MVQESCCSSLQHLLVTNAVVLSLFRVPITLTVLEAPKRGADGYPIGSGARSATLLLALFLADAVPAGNRVQ
jgi:hypothetical protein